VVWAQTVSVTTLLSIHTCCDPADQKLAGDYIGVGRDDGKKAGEYSPIIFRKSVWKVDTWKTVWLSETPDKPGSKGWDAASVRIVTVGTFIHQASKQGVVGMCTHLDDQGATSRTESAKLILKVANETTHTTRTARPLPAFLGGDLNSEPSGSAYRILNARDSAFRAVKDVAPRYGDVKTFTGFQEGNAKTELDHVFVDRRVGVWEATGFAVLPNKFDDGVYASDHRAVVGDVVLRVQT
jgi:endonuclease/exonuclease/phosphatase family metal-dependent hydrolase